MPPDETAPSDEHEADSGSRSAERHVEGSPVVRRIGDRDLFLGNEHAASPRYHDRSFDFVLSSTLEERPLTTHHRPLVDGPGNEWSVFEEAADTARRLYRRDGSVLIHCKAGISRSSTLVATTLAVEEDRELHDALGLVQTVRPTAMPHPALHRMALVDLAAKS